MRTDFNVQHGQVRELSLDFNADVLHFVVTFVPLQNVVIVIDPSAHGIDASGSRRPTVGIANRCLKAYILGTSSVLDVQLLEVLVHNPEVHCYVTGAAVSQPIVLILGHEDMNVHGMVLEGLSNDLDTLHH